MIRVEVVTAKGKIAMLLQDDSPSSTRLATDLITAVRVPAMACIVPIPPDVVGRRALYWYPKNEPPKETPNDQAPTPTGD